MPAERNRQRDDPVQSPLLFIPPATPEELIAAEYFYKPASPATASESPKEESHSDEEDLITLYLTIPYRTNYGYTDTLETSNPHCQRKHNTPQHPSHICTTAHTSTPTYTTHTCTHSRWWRRRRWQRRWWRRWWRRTTPCRQRRRTSKPSSSTQPQTLRKPPRNIHRK